LIILAYHTRSWSNYQQRCGMRGKYHGGPRLLRHRHFVGRLFLPDIVCSQARYKQHVPISSVFLGILPANHLEGSSDCVNMTKHRRDHVRISCRQTMASDYSIGSSHAPYRNDVLTNPNKTASDCSTQEPSRASQFRQLASEQLLDSLHQLTSVMSVPPRFDAIAFPPAMTPHRWQIPSTYGYQTERGDGPSNR